MIASGILTQSVTELFKGQISARLHRLAEASPRTVVIIVPSIRDAVSRHVVYPQGMLDRELLGLPKVNIICGCRLEADRLYSEHDRFRTHVLSL